MAMDADVIRSLESYWPQSPSQPPELSQLEELRRIASDPLPTAHFRLQFFRAADDAAATILDEVDLQATVLSAAIRESARLKWPVGADERRLIDRDGRDVSDRQLRMGKRDRAGRAGARRRRRG
jgi:hypothetical protein